MPAFCRVMNNVLMQPIIIYKLLSCQSSVDSSKQIFKQQSSETKGGKCFQVFLQFVFCYVFFALCLAFLHFVNTAFNQSEPKIFHVYY